MTRLRALFLDFDGLICDTEQAAHDSWTDTYARYGLAFPAELWARMVGRRDGEELAKADLMGRLGRPLNEQVWIERRRCKQRLADSAPTRAGVTRLLDEAAARGYRMAVVSSSSQCWLAGHLARLRLDHYFAAVVSGDDVRWHKPAPDLYLLALARLGFATTEVVAFEDALVGIQAAQAAAIRCVAVPNGVGTAADLWKADLVVPSIQEVDLRRLEEMGTGRASARVAGSPL
jgi:HAD superfamily hydrolase (TIGR01509 family)